MKPNKKKHFFRKCLFSAAHGILMIVLLMLWTLFDGSTSLEATQLHFQANTKRNTFLRNIGEQNYNNNDIVFIDVSNDKEIAFDSVNLKKEIITNRAILDSCLQAVMKYDYKFILCDIYFDIPTTYDTNLFATINKLKRIGFPNEDSVLVNNTNYKLPGGYVGYNYYGNFSKLSDNLSKFRLMHDSNNLSLPMFMYSSINNVQPQVKGDFIKFNSGKKGSYYLNNIAFDSQIQMEDLTITDHFEDLYTMSDFITKCKYEDSASTSSLLKNKIIVIGDFYSDIHETIFGNMPGTLILLNVFLSLSNGQNIITTWWLIFLWITFTIISYLLFYQRFTKPGNLLEKLKLFIDYFLGELTEKIFLYSAILLLCSFISYFLFNKTIEVIALALWLTFVEYLIGRYNSRDEIKKINSPKKLIDYLFPSSKQ